ncbi:MAG: peptide deformylase [Patescibacteria group bacterium]
MIVTDLEFLKRPCKDVSLFEAYDIIKQLELNLFDPHGIGLAANQIGINARVVILRTRSCYLDLVNPIIVNKYDLCSFDRDSCLSFPGVRLITQRYNEIFLKDLLHPAGIILTGLDSVVAQHECDHIDGITLFDRQIKIPFKSQPCWCGSGKKFKVCHYGWEIK